MDGFASFAGQTTKKPPEGGFDNQIIAGTIGINEQALMNRNDNPGTRIKADITKIDTSKGGT